MLMLLGIGGLPFAISAGGMQKSLNFQRDVRPILADNCFLCHGPDDKTRMANLRLDTKEGAFAQRDNRFIIAPGKPQESEFIKRITMDGVKKMPPPYSPNHLIPKQIETLTRWVKEGAQWEERHWAYIPPVRPAVPKVRAATVTERWVKNPIDSFILARLEKEGLKPSPVADRRTLIRRLSFDLTGLPPTFAEVESFVNDKSPDAYEKLVDRLLASPHFGERMAMYWLDLVRYADTRGYHGDQHQDVSPYRDYVIKAFNDNKPFDRFTVEQLAGDLLPNATLETRIASGYNRLLMTTEEGGAQPKEYMAKYAADRVRNVSAVWMGSTMGCSECHNHKYDPFTTRDFYSLAAFFADVKEPAVGQLDPIPLPTPEQDAQLKKLEAEMAPLKKIMATQTPELDAAQIEWEKTALNDSKLKKEIADILKVAPDKRTEKQKQDLAAYYRTIAPALEPTRKQLAELQRQFDAVNQKVVKTMVTTATEPRTVRILPRGNWLDDSGEIVQPAVPAFLQNVILSEAKNLNGETLRSAQSDKGEILRFAQNDKETERRATRLDLAQWLTSRNNPLTARVFVNRLWKIMFGHGIVRTVDDFGTRATPPSHPELLDWLAVEFMEPRELGNREIRKLENRGAETISQFPNFPVSHDCGWNVKHILKLMAMSATYRQTSQDNETLRLKDPQNSLFARQDRFRLDAEMVRDNALAVSGLLVKTIGGPSAKPYQPAGYWAYLNFPKREWQNDKGDGLYRRGLYTYWCRTYLHPSLLAFDASTREECAAERVRSNTPQQALVLLNDPTYVEAARVFAERIIREGGSDAKSRIRFAYQQALSRNPRPEETKLLTALYQQHLRDYEADKAAAESLLRVGDHPADKNISTAELAAWASVARVIFNLHESITRS